MQKLLLLCGGLLVSSMACSGVESSDPVQDPMQEQVVVEQQIVGASAGSIPAGLPARLQVGLFENTGATWMKNSGTPWDVRYRYFTKGWVNNSVMILLEADGYAFIQQQSGSNPNAYAAVAATGLPELAGLPNTVAGWGLAISPVTSGTAATTICGP